MKLFYLLKIINFKKFYFIYYSILPKSFCLLITNKPLKLIIAAPINILIDGTSSKIKYPNIIPKTITEYLADAVKDNGA